MGRVLPGTVYRQLSAQPPHRLLPLKKNFSHFCLDCHSVCDNVFCLLTMFSALAAVCTVYCAIEIVVITLHYITLHRTPSLPLAALLVAFDPSSPQLSSRGCAPGYGRHGMTVTRLLYGPSTSSAFKRELDFL